MAALDVGVDTAAVAPVRRTRRLGGLFIAATAWLALVALAAIFANILPIPSPTDIDLLGKRALPSAEHWLGNDQLGRDVLSRLIYGGRISLTVGLLAPVIGVTIGGCLGMLAGYFRGRFEAFTVGGVDVLLAFPPLVFALAVTAYLGQSVLNITLVIGILGIPTTRGDRLFLSLVLAAVIHLAWIGFVGIEPIAILPIGEGIELSSLWLASAISVVAAVIVFRTV